MQHYFFLIPVLCAVACLTSCVLFSRYAPKGMLLFAVEPLLSISTDSICWYHPELGNEVHNIFILSDTILLFLMAQPLLPPKVAKVVYSIAFPIFVLGWTLSIYRFGFSALANYSFAVGSLLVTAIYLIAFYYSETSVSSISKKPIRLICLALVLYHCGTFVFFCGIPYLMDDNIPEVIIDINTVFDSIKYILIAIAFYLFKKNFVTKASVS